MVEVSFIKSWLQKEPLAIFLFVTNDNAGYISAQATAAGIPRENIRISSAARADVPLFISLCDYSIFFIKPVFSKKASSPTKQGEIMAMGKPVICNSGVGDTDYVIKKYASGILIDELTDTMFDKVISKAVVPGQYEPEKIRKGASQFFALEEGVRRYEEVYKRVLND